MTVTTERRPAGRTAKIGSGIIAGLLAIFSALALYPGITACGETLCNVEYRYDDHGMVKGPNVAYTGQVIDLDFIIEEEYYELEKIVVMYIREDGYGVYNGDLYPDENGMYTLPAFTDRIDRIVIIATFSRPSYQIEFLNDDQTVLQSSEFLKGETPVYNGEPPTKEEDEQYIYTFTGWTPEITMAMGSTTYTATYTKTGKEYTVTPDNGTEYTVGSGEDLLFIVHCNVDDDGLFGKYTGVTVDDKAVPTSGSIAESGSLKLTLKAAYLDTLAAGDHRVVISFTHGSVETTVKVKSNAESNEPKEPNEPNEPNEPKPIPKTGDSAGPFLPFGLILLGIAGFAAAGKQVLSGRRKK